MGRYPILHQTQTYDDPANILAGIKNIAFDKRTFDPSPDDIEHICRFFSIGKLRNYKKDKGISISHRNPFVFVMTDRGRYALKFYAMDTASKIAAEYALNRILRNQHFPTPAMHAGEDKQPLLASHGRLATCFSYINGKQSWQCIKQHNTIRQINAVLLSLKNTLSMVKGRIPFRKQETLTTSINNALIQNSHATAPGNHKKKITAYLQDAFRAYQHHRPLFTRQCLHNHANFCNFLIYKKTAYLLDLEHIREDYILSDLVSLIIASLSFRTPDATIKTIVNDYFAQHKIKPDHYPVFNTLMKVRLIEEYLRIAQYENTDTLSTSPAGRSSLYQFHLSALKKSITDVLRKKHDNSTLIV